MLCPQAHSTTQHHAWPDSSIQPYSKACCSLANLPQESHPLDFQDQRPSHLDLMNVRALSASDGKPEEKAGHRSLPLLTIERLRPLLKHCGCSCSLHKTSVPSRRAHLPRFSGSSSPAQTHPNQSPTTTHSRVDADAASSPTLRPEGLVHWRCQSDSPPPIQWHRCWRWQSCR